MSETPDVTNLLIRSVMKEDTLALARLADQLGYATKPEDMIERLEAIMELKDHQVYVAEAAGAGVVGWVHVMETHSLVSQPQAELGGLIVEQDWRGHGVGALLLERAEGWARAHEYVQMRVNSNTARQGVPAFYESQGYDLIKTQNVFYKSLM